MREVLTTYKDRLVNISGRNRSLVLRKIYKKRTFDVVRAFQVQDIDLQPFIELLLHEESKACLIIDNAFKIRKQQLKDMRSKVDTERKEEFEALKNALKKRRILLRKRKRLFTNVK